MANQNSSASATQVAALLSSASFEERPALVTRYADDPRTQVRKACERALRRRAREEAERDRVLGMYEAMRDLGGEGVVVGVDEVGRGTPSVPFPGSAMWCPAMRASHASPQPRSSRK